jgi:hypothetical protein
VPLGGRAATREDPWAIDIEALAKAITPRTKILVLNSPHNPTGKVRTFLFWGGGVTALLRVETPHLFPLSPPAPSVSDRSSPWRRWKPSRRSSARTPTSSSSPTRCTNSPSTGATKDMHVSPWFIQTHAHSPPSPHTCTHPSPSPMEPGDSTSIGHYHFARLPGMFDRTITLSR